MNKSRKKLSRRIVALIVAGAILITLLFTVLGFFIAFWVSDAHVQTWVPDYEMISEEQLKSIYDKDELSDDDYRILYEQTGLTRIGVERARAKATGFATVKRIQQSFFKERGKQKELYAPLICTDYLSNDEYAEMIYLERGDILVTSSTHFAGFRIGHAAISTSTTGRIFQSNQVGQSNGYSTASGMFANRINFMVLRINPKCFSESGTADESYYDNLDRATRFIETQFANVPYNIFMGTFIKKDSIKGTNCAHLVWYGFKHFDDENGGRFNIDLDSNGRPLVVPKNISESEYVEVVQIFGFNPQKMYE